MDYDRAKSALSGTRFPDLRHVSETGSTNADVRDLLATGVRADRDGPDGHIVLVADYQSAGRGRLDRSWEAPPGASILMSIGLPLGPIPIDRTALLTMALSVATLGAIEDIGIGSVRLKWPNDVVVPEEAADPDLWTTPFGYRKMGGVLAEFIESAVHGPSVVLGIGLNINWGAMPASLAKTSVSLDELARVEIDRWDLVRRIVIEFDQTWLPVVAADDPAELLVRYSSVCSTIGAPVRAELPDVVLAGVASGITPSGALVVNVRDQRHVVTAGDVIHVRPDL